MSNIKVSKIMIWPTRKFTVGPFNTAELSAGVEIVLEKPVDSDSKEVEKAFRIARRIVRGEFKKQYEPYRKLITKDTQEKRK